MKETEPPICGVVVSSSWHAPVACAYPPNHTGEHSWATIPAFDPRRCGYQGFGSGDHPTGPGCTLSKDHDGPCQERSS